MIKFSDATLLALTKLRAHKIRTIVTTLLASLLFGVLIAGSLVVNGVFNSIDNFSTDGLTSRYIVNVNNAIVQTTSTSVLRDKELIDKAKVQYTDLIEKKTIEAKRLGVSYTQVSDQPPYMVASDGGEMLYLNDRNGIVKSLLAEKYGGKTYIDDTRLEATAKQYGVTKLFTVETFNVKRGASLSVLPSGKEAFYDTSDRLETNTKYTQPIVDSTFPIAPSELTEPFLLPNNAGWKANDNTLPIIIPQNVAEQLLNLEKPPTNASGEQKLDRIKEIRSKTSDFTFQACYRNSASLDLIQQTVVQLRDAKASKADKKYELPPLIYELPDATKCAEPLITSDTRTNMQKQQDGNQKLFDQKFNFYTEPKSYFVTFKIVGISPIQSNNPEQNRSAADVINNLLKTTGVGQLIPKDLYDQMSDKSKYADILKYEPHYFLGNEDNKTRYLEFSNAQNAQKFIDEQSCTTQYDGTCKPVGRDYMATLSFSDSIALDDVRGKTAQWFNLAVLGVVTLAAVVMWLTIGRTITDGRHETAVFRAIGFKRIDISLVYIIYTVMLSIFVAILAGLIGLVGAYFVDTIYSPQLTAQAQYAFGGLDLSKEFSLIGFNAEQLCIIIAACLLTGALSMIIPLIRNVRRSPIRDMRDDS